MKRRKRKRDNEQVINMANPKESMYVVWSEGKSVTVIKPKRSSLFSSKSAPPPKVSPVPPLQQQYVAPPAVKRNSAGGSTVRLEKEYNALKSKEQEDQVELRRLRTENRLLRQRIDNLEKETATLADRLIQDQVIRAQREEEVFVLKRELSTIKQDNASTKQKLQETDEELRSYKEQESIVASNSSYESQVSQEDRIQELQEQMTHMRQRDHESTCTVKELKDKIKELEYINRQLQQDPSAEIQSLQEELIACKLREAEGNRSMQELKQRVIDLEKYWQKHLEKANPPAEAAAGSKQQPSKDKMKALQEEVMNVRLREAQSIAELQEMKQKVMELETQNQIASRQIKRMDEENHKLKDSVQSGEEREKELKHQIKELERNLADIESKKKKVPTATLR